MRYNFVTVCLVVLAQVLLCNYLHISFFLTLSLLPVLVLCLPTRYGTIPTLLFAFATGFAVDFMAEGVLGLNVVALLPVAGLKRTLCTAFFGEELISRNDNFSFKKYGPAKVIMALAVSQAIFLFFYIWEDGGSVVPFSDSLIRWIVSMLCGLAVCVPIADMLTKEDNR